MDVVEEVLLDSEKPKYIVRVGFCLTIEKKMELITFLKENMRCFT